MKLIRFGNPGEEKPGIIVDEKRFDVSTFGTDYTRFFLENNGLKTLNDWFIQTSLNVLSWIHPLDWVLQSKIHQKLFALALITGNML